MINEIVKESIAYDKSDSTAVLKFLFPITAFFMLGSSVFFQWKYGNKNARLRIRGYQSDLGKKDAFYQGVGEFRDDASQVIKYIDRNLKTYERRDNRLKEPLERLRGDLCNFNGDIKAITPNSDNSISHCARNLRTRVNNAIADIRTALDAPEASGNLEATLRNLLNTFERRNLFLDSLIETQTALAILREPEDIEQGGQAVDVAARFHNYPNPHLSTKTGPH